MDKFCVPVFSAKTEIIPTRNQQLLKNNFRQTKRCKETSTVNIARIALSVAKMYQSEKLDSFKH